VEVGNKMETSAEPFTGQECATARLGRSVALQRYSMRWGHSGTRRTSAVNLR
jgi:hypothetical protein